LLYVKRITLCVLLNDNKTCKTYNFTAMINFFEFYGIAESFNPDIARLKKKFYELSKQYHPDFHANETDEKQQEILELSTINNKAWQTLSVPAKRLEYILRQHELLVDGAKPALPADFLMEMMDINERLMEIDDAEQLADINNEVLAVDDDINQKLSRLTKDYHLLDDAAKESRLNEILDIYYRQKYLLRIKESLNTFAARF
jgi:molecular chaperone HscB